MQISAKLVKELRDITGAGMMDCKKALEETNGNIEEAIDFLREKGIAKAAKKTGRIAAEGLCDVVVKGNEAVVFELNSETDFVAKNTNFLDLIKKIAGIIIDSKATNTEEALELKTSEGTVLDIVNNATAKIGEKISLRRVSRIVKEDGQGFGAYLHMGGRIVSLVVTAKEDENVAKDVAMHVAANNPRFLDRSQVDEATLEHEKQVLTNQALQEGKPINIVEKMVVGRVNKFLQEICLVDQPFVKDPDLTVQKYLENNKNSVLSYVRLEVGEGIEKREEDFAAEVLAATQNK